MLATLLLSKARSTSKIPALLVPLWMLMTAACGEAPSDTGHLSGATQAGAREGTFYLKSVHSDKCLDVTDGAAANGTKMQQWDCVSGKAQMWRLLKTGDGFQLRSVLTGKCLDVENRSKVNGARIQQWDCSDSDHQKFRFEGAGDGPYKIIAKNSGKALDVADHSKENGGKIQQWDKGDSDNQSFQLIAAALPSFIHTEGTRIVDANGKDLFMRGINLGNWLVWEGYLMMGDFNFRTHSQFLESLKQVFGSEGKAKEFERQWRLNYVDGRAIEDLKTLGYNSVRVPFHYNMFWKDGKTVDDGFEYFDRLIEQCRKHNISILLDMHAAPGHQNPGDHSDNGDSNADQPRNSVKFWDGNNIDIAAKVWKHIANRYKNETSIWGYDLFNEPVPQAGREYELLPSLIRIRNAIREVDKNHIIVAEASWWASDLPKIDWTNKDTQKYSGVSSRWDDNLVYQIHHYGPAADTFGRENITNKLNVPLILGEFGENNNENLKKTNDWAKTKTAGTFLWSFKKVSHDKTLWSIPTNEAYETMKKHITKKTKAPDEVYKAVLDFAKTNIRNGNGKLVWDRDFFEAIDPNPEIRCPCAAIDKD